MAESTSDTELGAVEGSEAAGDSKPPAALYDVSPSPPRSSPDHHMDQISPLLTHQDQISPLLTHQDQTSPDHHLDQISPLLTHQDQTSPDHHQDQTSPDHHQDQTSPLITHQEATSPPSSHTHSVSPKSPKSVAFDIPDSLESDDEGAETEQCIKGDIDDALDEGYMGMECTLERGFSLNESTIARDLRQERYDEIAIKYQPGQGFSRYCPSLSHCLPFRKTRKSDEMPVDGAGLYSFTMLAWMTSLMWKAYKKGLKAEDIPLCSKYDMCEYNTDRLEHLWQEEEKQRGREGASLNRVVWIFFRTRFLLGTVLFTVRVALSFIGPVVFMRYLIDWLSTEEPLTTGLTWACCFILVEVLRVVIFCLVWVISYRNGIRLRAACLGLVYRKLMRMVSLGNKSVGEVINLFANDAQRLDDLVVIGVMFMGGPLVAVGGTVYILWLLGPWALCGMAAFLLFYPFQYCMSRLTGYYRRQTVAVTDERVRMMNELLSCIKLIKMYAWEESFATTISEIREQEKQLLEKSSFVQSLTLSMAPTVPIVAAIVTFLAHIGAGNDLTPAQAMSVIALFVGIGRSSFNTLRFSVKAIVEGLESLRRIKSILDMEELMPYVGLPQQPDTTVELRNATLAWDAVSVYRRKNHNKRKKKDSLLPADQLFPKIVEPKVVEVLFDINLSIKQGELVGMCGGVGAGKSSLVSAVLGHMRLQQGWVGLQGSVAYVGQQAWVLNTTFRDNILLDQPFDAKRYYRVIHACSLSQDLDSMPAGDLTEIGERGINLSGGQKQRLSLARAIYACRDVYLLDDPLSAVDSHVGSHIFQWVMKEALKDCTILFVTHQLQYLPQCDRVVFMQEGRLGGQGTHSSLLHHNQEYAALYQAHMDTMQESAKKEQQTQRVRQDSVMSSGSERSSPEKTSTTSTRTKQDSNTKGKGKLVSEEKLERGDVPWDTYRAYIEAAGGYLLAALVTLTFLLNVGSTAFTSWWLSVWLAAGSGNTTMVVGNDTVVSDSIAHNPDRHFYQTVYGSFILVILVTSLIRGFAFIKTTLRASSRMHDLVFLRMFHSPISFFDTTPSGRILNIFSRDMDEVDVRLPFTMETFLLNMFLIATSLLFVCLVFPHFLPVLCGLGIIFWVIRNVFRVGVREVKRLENVSRSPLYSHISTTITGLPAIHAYGKQHLFTKRFMVLFDENSCAFYLFNCAMRWLAVRLDLLALLVISGTTILSLALRGKVEASFAGLALAYATQLSGIFQYTVRLSTETEARFTSVQRVNNYLKVLVPEGAHTETATQPHPSWPDVGRISFRSVQMSYRPDTPLVLKGVTFTVRGQEHIGIVGRTGSGKSSLGVALFRLVELSGGSIRIDGLDISTLRLHDLRSQLAVIPQDPTLFIGTVRYNLDPFSQHSDEAVWKSLEQTYMKERVANLSQGLRAPVVENGHNFSVGERQLLCMARALLRNSKIIFLDEATAAIDTEMDSKIQQTLKEAFHTCTTLTIAHRLNTVMWCSRVLVMEEGQIVEYDAPHALLANPTSLFACMVARAEASITY